METSTKPSSKVMYLSFIDSMSVNSNGFLVVNNETRTIDLIPYKLEKYHLNNGIISTMKIVKYTSDDNNLNQNQSTIKVNLDHDYHIVDYDYNVQKATLENLLTENIPEKLTGIYAGIFERSKKAILNYSEAGTFILINSALERIEKMDEKMELLENDAELENIKREKRNWEYGLDFCLAHLARFGVTQKYNNVTDRMEQTPTFKAWFNWWGDYFKNILGTTSQNVRSEENAKTDYDAFFEQCAIKYQAKLKMTAQVASNYLQTDKPVVEAKDLNDFKKMDRDNQEQLLFEVFAQCQRTGQDYGLFKPQGSFLDYIEKDKVVLRKERPIKSLPFSQVKVS